MKGVKIRPSKFKKITSTKRSLITTVVLIVLFTFSGGANTSTLTFETIALAEGKRQGDNNKNSYPFIIQDESENSKQSDIVETTSSFSYRENINYTAYQGNPITSTSNSVGVFKFDIRDGGETIDADEEGTELTAITFDVINNENIRNAALFNGNLKLTDGVVSGSTIIFNSLSGVDYTAPDGGVKTITLRVSFKNTITDNEQIQFTITTAIANASGSEFATAAGGGVSSSITGDRNRIEVTADRLAFVQQPSTTNTNIAMLSVVTTEATDLNGNRDLDFTSDIQVTSTGTLTDTPISTTASNGIATFSSLIHSEGGTELTLIAKRTGTLDWDIVSSPFDIILFTFDAGDLRSRFATDFSTNGDWEYYTGSTWISSAGSDWDGKAPQNTSTTINRIIIDKTVTGGESATHNYDCDIIIQNGGTLELVENDTPPIAAEFLSADNTLEVESGCELIISGDIDLASTTNLIVREGATITINQGSMTNDHPMWDGVEKFEGGSFFVINDWNWTSSPTVRSVINESTVISDNDNGYKFGAIIIDASPTGNWTLVSGALNLNFVENDISISNTSTYNIQLMSNKTSGISTTVGGSLYVLDGDFSISGTSSSDDFNHTVNISGDLEILSDAAFFLHRNNVNTPNSINSTLNIAGNVIIDGPTTFSSNQASSSTSYGLHFNGEGSSVQLLNVTPNVSNVHFIAASNSSVALSSNPLRFAGNAHFEVENGATFNFGFDTSNNALFISQVSGSYNKWSHRSGAYTYITAPAGLDETNNSDGNVRNIPASNRSTGQIGSTFHYIGKTNQESGDFHTSGSTSKTIIVELDNNTNTLTLNHTTGTSTLLDIRQGVFVETESNHISGSGDVTISGGGFRTSVITSTGIVPQLTGSYSFSGGFVELNATNDQTLRGSRNYYDLTISGANTAGVNDKTSTSAFTVANKLTITDSPIFDLESHGMTGAAGITMDGGVLKMAKLNTTLPELEGTATSYNITGGTIAFYGSGATQIQRLKGKDGSSNAITYHNIEINATTSNLDFSSDLGNVTPAASFGISGTLDVNSPASFRLDATNSVFGIGNVNINDGATLFYASPDGINTSGSSVNDGNIRVTGTRTFSKDASYGFTGNQAMVSGNALPSEVVNLYLVKSATINVALTNSIEVKQTLQFEGGVLQTIGTNEIVVSNDLNTAIVNGETSGTDKYVEGRLKWVTASDQSYTFPIGHSTQNAQGFSIDVTGNGAILGYLENNSSAPVYDYAYCDLETSSSTDQQVGQGSAGFDGVLDQVHFNLASPLQWNITNPTGGVTSYDLEVLASGGQDVSTIQSANGTAVRYLMKNGVPGNTGVATTLGAPSFNDTGFLSCPNQYSLSGLTSFSKFTLDVVTAANTALPIDLIAFTADVIRNQTAVLLKWQTVSEINNNYYTVERSADGFAWEVIETVKGAGTSTKTLSYDHIDKDPLQGVSYYRLKQTDFDGNYEYLDIQSIEINASKRILLHRVNTLGQKVGQTYKGIVFLYYSDGSTMKIFQY